ncbi:YicC/YloC family endoribonuclease [Nannocystaceae bacterium ST9]
MPLFSMTGFGLAERPWTERSATVRIELRSVNARFLELKLRQPFGVASEHDLRKQIEARLGRGRVDLTLRVDEAGSQSDALIDLGVETAKVSVVLAALSAVSDAANQASFPVTHPTALDVLRFLISLRGPAGGGIAYDEPPAFLTELVDEACTRLLAMREQEGRALQGVLASLLAELEQQVERLVAGLAGEAERLHEQLATRVRALLDKLGVELDRGRLAQEVAILVQRGDVSEELARIASHLDQARGVLAAPAEVGQGKTLDFLAQELLREVTTIGSKITSHEGSATVIAAKRTIERIREQVQNVE